MKNRYQDIMDEFDAYMDKVAYTRIPESEEEMVTTVDFFAFFLCQPPDHECVLHGEAFVKKHPFWLSFTNLVNLICVQFQLRHPADKFSADEQTFQMWFEKCSTKYLHKSTPENYNKFLFGLVAKVADPKYPVV